MRKKDNPNQQSQTEHSADETDLDSAKTGPTDALQMQINELTDTLKRVQAEFENYKKRIDKENAQLIKNSNAILIKDMLPVLDSFELAIKNSNGNNTGNNNGNTTGNNHTEIDKFKKGMEMIYAQFFSILEDQGLRIIDIKNKKFDPFKHEVLMVKETDQDEDIILQEFQKGYMLNDIVLRHSKVMISKKHSVADKEILDKEDTDGK